MQKCPDTHTNINAETVVITNNTVAPSANRQGSLNENHHAHSPFLYM